MIRNKILPHEFNISQIQNYFGLSIINREESYKALCRYINEDGLVLHYNAKKIKLTNTINESLDKACFSGEVRINAIKFDSLKTLFKRTNKPDNTFIVHEVEVNGSTYRVNNKSGVIISDNMLIGKRDNLVNFLTRDSQREESLSNQLQPTPLIKPKIKTSILEKRIVKLTNFCLQIKSQKKLPDSSHQTVYNSYNPPLTQDDFWLLLQDYDSALFALGKNDFYKSKEVNINFKKGARSKVK